MPTTEHARRRFFAVAPIASGIDGRQIDAMALGMAAVREPEGRFFILGVGGGARHVSRAVKDLRLRIFQMDAELEPPAPDEQTFGNEDASSRDEWEHFAIAIGTDGKLLGGLHDACYAWPLVEERDGGSPCAMMREELIR